MLTTALVSLHENHNRTGFEPMIFKISFCVFCRGKHFYEWKCKIRTTWPDSNPRSSHSTSNMHFPRFHRSSGTRTWVSRLQSHRNIQWANTTAFFTLQVLARKIKNRENCMRSIIFSFAEGAGLEPSSVLWRANAEPLWQSTGRHVYFWVNSEAWVVNFVSAGEDVATFFCWFDFLIFLEKR